ncbi:HlyD family efflux transporter periplasmic adaptor subunit [Vibrio scophthalmi]|nr:HlyD family efflux transporter periplasmic adaptor subunit [Vibrio scophthalmi]
MNKIGFLCALVFSVGLILFQKIEVVIPTNGTIVGESSDVDVITPDSGFINIINVKSGDVIKKDEVLFSYDNLDVFYKKDSINDTINSLNVALDTNSRDVFYLSELQNNAVKGFLEFPFDSVDALDTNYKKYQYWYLDIQEESRSAISLIDIISKEKVFISEKKSILAKKLKLLQSSLSPEINVLDLRTQIVDLDTNFARLESEEVNTKRELSRKSNEYIKELSDTLRTLEEKIVEIKTEVSNLSIELELNERKQIANTIVSPVDGVVFDVQQNFAVGSFLDASKVVLKIKRTSSKSNILVELPARYRPYVNIESKARILIESPLYREPIIGQVAKIGVDSERSKENENDNSRYFKVEVESENAELLDSSLIGLKASVYILKGNISIFNYLLSTFDKSITVGVW